MLQLVGPILALALGQELAELELVGLAELEQLEQ